MEPNVRTPLTRPQALDIIEQAGWRIQDVETVVAQELEDADWEIANCLRTASGGQMAKSISLMRQLAKDYGNPSLNTYAVVAEQ